MAAEGPKIRVELSEHASEIPKGTPLLFSCSFVLSCASFFLFFFSSTYHNKKDIEMPDLGEEVNQQGYVKIKIHHFSALKDIKKHYLEPFEVCGKQW